MKKLIITNGDNSKMTVDLIRYFSFNNDSFLIYTLNETDEKGYLKLYLVRIMEELGFPVVQTIKNEADWSKMQGIVKKVLKELKKNNKKLTIDLNYSEIEGIKIVEPRFFKLDPKLVEILSANYLEDGSVVPSIDSKVNESLIETSGANESVNMNENINTIPQESTEEQIPVDTIANLAEPITQNEELESIDKTLENLGEFTPVDITETSDSANIETIDNLTNVSVEPVPVQPELTEIVQPEPMGEIISAENVTEQQPIEQNTPDIAIEQPVDIPAQPTVEIFENPVMIEPIAETTELNQNNIDDSTAIEAQPGQLQPNNLEQQPITEIQPIAGTTISQNDELSVNDNNQGMVAKPANVITNVEGSTIEESIQQSDDDLVVAPVDMPVVQPQVESPVEIMPITSDNNDTNLSETLANEVKEESTIAIDKDNNVDYKSLYEALEKDNQATNELLNDVITELTKYKEKYGELEN